MIQFHCFSHRLHYHLAITTADVQAHIRDILAQVNLRILVVGNIYKDEAIKIAEMAEQGLGKSPIDLSDRALLLPPGNVLSINVKLFYQVFIQAPTTYGHLLCPIKTRPIPPCRISPTMDPLQMKKCA